MPQKKLGHPHHNAPNHVLDEQRGRTGKQQRSLARTGKITVTPNMSATSCNVRTSRLSNVTNVWQVLVPAEFKWWRPAFAGKRKILSEGMRTVSSPSFAGSVAGRWTTSAYGWSTLSHGPWTRVGSPPSMCTAFFCAAQSSIASLK